MELLTLPRMARRLGVTAKWLRAEADAKRLPCVRAGRAYLFAAQRIEELLAARAATGSKEEK
jgi:hypothetical protein